MRNLKSIALISLVGVCILSGETLQERIESVRAKELDSRTIAEERGVFVVDKKGRKNTLSLLRRVANELGEVGENEDILTTYSYLRDPDARLRVIAFYLLNDELRVYGVSDFPFRALSESDQNGISELRREMLSSFAQSIGERMREPPVREE